MLILIGLYLSAIVAANLSVAYFGPGATIVNAFLFIGLDLTSRDKLHEAWHGKGLIWKMALLIATGSLISYILNRGVGQIAIASFVAFGLSAIADTVTYSLLHKRAYIVKVNGSNVVSSAIDSLVFPTLAFGSIMPLVILGQFSAKIAGGFMWSVILGRNLKITNTQIVK